MADVLYRSPFGGALLRDGDRLVSQPEAWFKSSYSADTANCVEAAHVPHGVLVRDSKDPAGSVLTFGLESWRAFISDVKVGRLG